jgi:hypothetical protein
MDVDRNSKNDSINMNSSQENIASILTLLNICLFIYARKIRNVKLHADIDLFVKYIFGLAIGLIHCFIGSALLYYSNSFDTTVGVFFSLYMTLPAVFIARWNTKIAAVLLFAAGIVANPWVILEQEPVYAIALSLIWTVPMFLLGIYFFRYSCKKESELKKVTK